MVLKFLFALFIVVLSVYYATLFLSIIGVTKRISTRTVTIKRLFIPFYFWVYIN